MLNLGSIVLGSSWSGNDPYYQVVTVTGCNVTRNSKIDLQFSAENISALIAADVQAIWVENNNGTITVYSLGGHPTSAMTIQCTVLETGQPTDGGDMYISVYDPTNAVATAGGIAAYVAANAATNLTFDSTPTSGSTNPVTSGGVKSYVDDGLATKQNTLTFDATPTTGSTNPVTSGGVKSYVDSHYVTAGQKSATTLGTKATAEGYDTVASAAYTHAEGDTTTASGTGSHAEGSHTNSSGGYSHAEGYRASASGWAAHAEGSSTTASGYYSHAEGQGTTASGVAQHVFGKYNRVNSNYVEIVGNGSDDSDRSNARTLDWNGNEVVAGKITVGAHPTAAMDVATKGYVDALLTQISALEARIEALEGGGASVENHILTADRAYIDNNILVCPNNTAAIDANDNIVFNSGSGVSV